MTRITFIEELDLPVCNGITSSAPKSTWHPLPVPDQSFMTSLNNESIATTVDTSIPGRARWMKKMLEVG